MALTTIEMNTLEKISQACKKYMQSDEDIDWEARQFALFQILLQRYLDEGDSSLEAAKSASNASEYYIKFYKDYFNL